MDKLQSSVKQQEVIISTFIKSDSKSNMYAQVHSELSDEYFTDPTCKMIYKAVQTYYTRYRVLPTYNETMAFLDNVFIPSYGVALDDVRRKLEELEASEDCDPDYIKDVLEKFIKNFRMRTQFIELVNKIKENPNGEIPESVYHNFIESLNVDLSTEEAFPITVESFIKARSDALGEGNLAIKSFMPEINSIMSEGGWVRGSLNMIVGPPGTGKSMWLFNEGANALKQGYKVLHILIGDLLEYDGMTRYISCMGGYPQRQLSIITKENVSNIIDVINDQYDNAFNNLRIVAYPSYTLRPEQLVDHIKRFQRLESIKFDMIIIDYPDNLIKKGNNMYEDGGIIYNYLEQLAKTTKSVVLTASQPKIEYYNEEIIPLAGAAESSRKQQCVDSIFSFNAHARNARFGTLFCAKSRRGNGTGRIIRWASEYEKCKISQIEESEYKDLLKEYNDSDTKLPDATSNSGYKRRTS